MYSKLKFSEIDRRRLLQGAAAAGLTMVALPLLPRGARAADDLTVLEWAGYEEPKLRPEFAPKHGDPAYSFFAEEEEALQKLRSGFQADISHPCNAMISRFREAGVVKPLDTSRIARWNDIIPELLDFQGIEHDGKTWFMPYDWGFSSIGYRTDMVEEENPTYAMAIDERYKGQFAMSGQFDVALGVAGEIAGFKDIFNPTEEEMAKIPELFRRLVETSKFLWADQTEIENAMANKEVLGGWLWSASLKNLRDQNIPVKMIDPVFTWACGYMINQGGEGSEDVAYEYLNALLDPAGGKELVNWGYGHSVAESFSLADPKVVESLGLGDVKTFFATGKIFDAVAPDKRDRLIAEWEKARVG